MDLTNVYSPQKDLADDWLYRDSAGDYYIKYNGLTFRSVFQPIVDSNNNTYGFEGLVRITDENGNSISPYAYFKSTENCDYESVLSVIICAKIHLNNFAQSIHSDKKLFINATPSIFNLLANDPGAVKWHLERLRLLGLSPKQIVWEIMEFKDSDTIDICNGIKILAEHGIQVALDDYGAEYSTETRAKILLPEIVKLDRSLLHNLMSDNAELIDKAVQVCRSIGAKIIAEGIENKEEYRILQSYGIDFFQGYYLGRPAPISNKTISN